MLKTRRLVLLIILLLVVYIFVFIHVNKHANINRFICEMNIPVIKTETKKPDFTEKIIYEVSLNGLSLGESVFQYLSKAKLDNKEVDLMTFQTNLINFNDSEIIYSDPKTQLPLKVERFVSAWPFPEKITEDYDQKNFILTIRKEKGNKQEEKIIKKDKAINNAVLLPFYLRNVASFNEGASLDVELPTQSFKLQLVDKEEIEVPAGKFLAYHFISDPGNFEVWISADEQKIPLKIKKTSGLGYTLTMKSYNKQQRS